MFHSINKVTLLGNLGQDPKIIPTKNGRSFVTLSLATNRLDSGRGYIVQVAEWHKVVILAPNAIEYAKKYLKKGDPVHVEGEIRYKKYIDVNNREVCSTEIVVSSTQTVLRKISFAKSDDTGTQVAEALSA